MNSMKRAQANDSFKMKKKIHVLHVIHHVDEKEDKI